jgi:hypothetical protein
VEFDEEQDVEAAERERFNGEEIAGEHARRLPAKKRRPTRSSPPRRRLKAGGGKQPSNRARREAEAQLDQFAGDSLITPERGFSRASRSTRSHSTRSVGGRPGLRCEYVHLLRTNSRCQRRSLAGVTTNP